MLSYGKNSYCHYICLKNVEIPGSMWLSRTQTWSAQCINDILQCCLGPRKIEMAENIELNEEEMKSFLKAILGPELVL